MSGPVSGFLSSGFFSSGFFSSAGLDGVSLGGVSCFSVLSPATFGGDVGRDAWADFGSAFCGVPDGALVSSPRMARER